MRWWRSFAAIITEADHPETEYEWIEAASIGDDHAGHP
jgi:hypothetical protein